MGQLAEPGISHALANMLIIMVVNCMKGHDWDVQVEMNQVET